MQSKRTCWGAATFMRRLALRRALASGAICSPTQAQSNSNIDAQTATTVTLQHHPLLRSSTVPPTATASRRKGRKACRQPTPLLRPGTPAPRSTHDCTATQPSQRSPPRTSGAYGSSPAHVGCPRARRQRMTSSHLRTPRHCPGTAVARKAIASVSGHHTPPLGSCGSTPSHDGPLRLTPPLRIPISSLFTRV